MPISFNKKESLYLLAFIGLGGCVYLNSLRGLFIVDDVYTVVWNFPLRNLSNIGQIVGQNLFAAAGRESSYFRPLTQLSFGLDFYLWGLNPIGYKLTSLVLHLGNAILLFYLAKRVLPLTQSALVSLFFIVHPVNMQAIAYISSRSDPLFFFFTVLTVHIWINEKRSLRPFCLLTFLLGLFSKEPAVVMLPLILLTDLTRCESWNEVKSRLRSNCPWYIGLGGVLFAYLALRLWVLGYPLLMGAGQEGLTVSQRLLLAGTLLGKHLILLLLPLDLAFVHVVSLSLDPFAPVFLGSLLLVIGLGYLALKLWKIERAIAFGLGWFLIAIFPVLNLTLLNLPLMESWLYLPEVGLFILMVALFRLLVKPRALRILMACVVLSLLTMRAIVRSADWGNPVRLFEKNIQLYPASPIAWSGLAQAYSGAGRDKESLEAFKKALSLGPEFWTPHYALGIHYFSVEEYDRAEKEFLLAATLNPKVAWPHYSLGISHFRSGLWKEAQEEFMKASLSKPHIPMLYHLMGSTYLAVGERALAEEAFQKALKETPGKNQYHAGIHTELGGLLLGSGLMEDAKRELVLVLRFDPKNKEAREKLDSLE